jgi:hypothetical protein
VVPKEVYQTPPANLFFIYFPPASDKEGAAHTRSTIAFVPTNTLKAALEKECTKRATSLDRYDASTSNGKLLSLQCLLQDIEVTPSIQVLIPERKG